MRDGQAAGIVIDPPPHDRNYFLSHLQAMSRYWNQQSFGNLVVEYDVYPKADSASYRLGDTGDYGPWTLGSVSYASAQDFFRDAVAAADAADSIPFGNFDVFVVFHAGSDYQADVNRRQPAGHSHLPDRAPRFGARERRRPGHPRRDGAAGDGIAGRVLRGHERHTRPRIRPHPGAPRPLRHQHLLPGGGRVEQHGLGVSALHDDPGLAQRRHRDGQRNPAGEPRSVVQVRCCGPTESRPWTPGPR